MAGVTDSSLSCSCAWSFRNHYPDPGLHDTLQKAASTEQRRHVPPKAVLQLQLLAGITKAPRSMGS